MSDFELQILELKRKIEELEGIKNEKRTYQYSKVRDIDLESIVNIEKNLDRKIFDKWFNNKIEISESIVSFLKDLILNNETLLYSYSEEDLKVNFLIPLLNKVNFKSFENEIRAFYELAMIYESEDFILKGTTDFVVSKGLVKSKKPYFFIQEFKRGKENSDPEPQLLAELITAVELNNWKFIKGAYIIGENWKFVVLERLEKHKYQYFISQNFDSTKINDLKEIFKNLLFVKNEITDMIQKEK